MEPTSADEGSRNGHSDTASTTTTGRPGLKRSRSSYDKPPTRVEIMDEIMNSDYKASDSGDGKSLRFPADPLDYPRRRATIACEM
jgi:hypothetical protein